MYWIYRARYKPRACLFTSLTLPLHGYQGYDGMITFLGMSLFIFVIVV